mmetsp:Transcript_514/g.1104  ORF Transcript_514/g.1104 Transcript_514/m.1104 type:complete len:446 (+) Transcript_514:52-1389(+)
MVMALVSTLPLVRSTHKCSFNPKNKRYHVQARTCLRLNRKSFPVTALLELTPKSVVVERSLGTVGFLTLSSWPPREPDNNEPIGYNITDAAKMGSQELEPSSLQTRLYAGRIVTGPSANAQVVLKAYPNRRDSKGVDADAMAANEFSAYAAIQPPAVEKEDMSPYIYKLLGGFEATEGLTAGEKWLVFRNDGLSTAASYAAEAAKATSEGRALGEGEFWDNLDESRPIARRRAFIKLALYQALLGLAYLHKNDRLHQSLGPNSLVLSTTSERDVRTLRVRLQDLAFSVDISSNALKNGLTLEELLDQGPSAAKRGSGARIQELSKDLWLRADAAGARTPMEKRAYGIADDIYGAGLLLAYMAFVPMSQPGSVDGPSLLKTLEGTFRLDVLAASDFYAADDRFKPAVAFLDDKQKAGWKLLQAMLNPDWRKRPTVEGVLKHPFFAF